LAGLIDYDGSLLVSKQGYSSCEITLQEHEIQAASKIKRVLGGSITPRSKAKAIRWRLHNRAGMIKLINLINGKLLHPNKQTQLINVCKALGIIPITNNVMATNNSWLAGFVDGDGSLNIKNTTYQISITIGQKVKTILDQIVNTFSCGKVYYDKSWDGWIFWASSNSDLSTLFDYFTRFPLLTPRNVDLITLKRLIRYKNLNYHLKPIGSPERTQFDRLVKLFHSRKKR
jgi:LAGLIDADG endonuclease